VAGASPLAGGLDRLEAGLLGFGMLWVWSLGDPLAPARPDEEGPHLNNDLTTSMTTGDTWTATFSGTGVAVYAPKESGSGKIEIPIDGQTRETAPLAGARPSSSCRRSVA
jgi:hypothetical protein